MFWTRKNKEQNRYYLLPGMGRSNRRHHQQTLLWAVIVGIICAALLGTLIYLWHRR
jgi:high-affinity Fe2+/Pb2+ permease